MLLTANIFQPLIDVFEAVLKFFHNSGGISWGWSIVLLTVCMRLILVPLTVKQFHSMQALQRLQPEMKALQQKYKEDKQRQQQEMMRFYKENNVNPLGSCLPMVLQLPVFISLYYMLRQSLRDDICHGKQLAFQARYAAHHPHVAASTLKGLTTACGAGHGSHAGFLFIGDLTNGATGATLVVLIVLYVGTQLASSLLMAQPTMDQTQRRIMLVMPLFFVIFIIQFPAGLIVYWITTNTWTMLQQFVLRRRLGRAVAPVPAVTTGPTAVASGPGGSGGRGVTRTPTPPRDENGAAAAGSSGGLGGLLRGLGKSGPAEPSRESGRSRTAAPPPPPRKKKKRSGRRR
jgi:YidC/Oxa1 family membrane protein insertase